MSPIHFELLEPVFKKHGFHLVFPDNDNRRAIDTGLKFVNNDACFPSLIVVGQIMDAILSGKYDTNHLAVIKMCIRDSIVAVLKVKFGTNETLLTLMLNYVAIYLIQYCQSSIGIFQKDVYKRQVYKPLPKFPAVTRDLSIV